ncbi:MAG: Acetyl-CoA decarbonylase/synthase complex subunit gamma 1 [Candidatus Methanogaster sp.]|nr:MAG: Acetyl-CoA decarbonylase/synthase complex subunit gamma 1 [ANME-2 cluster archaeon]
MKRQIYQQLPGFNCGECGYTNCTRFAAALVEGDVETTGCPFLLQDRFKESSERVDEILSGKTWEGAEDAISTEEEAEITGLIDHLAADFVLAPLRGEPSCREDLHPFDWAIHAEVGDILRYRPWGCPITHFAEVLAVAHGIVTVHVVGPLHRLGSEIAWKNVGLCMVVGFEGLVIRGDVPDVGATVRFLPEHCMMGKVHSGVIVHSEGDRVRIEGIDLKVW